MSLLIAFLVLVLIGLVVLAVGAPLRRARRVRDSGLAASSSSPGDDAPATAPPHARHELEAAREAKYREIRDAELDFRTGKLSREDYHAIDAELRSEAIEILNRLEAGERKTVEEHGESTDAPEAPGESADAP